jgi:hypothetical protein
MPARARGAYAYDPVQGSRTILPPLLLLLLWSDSARAETCPTKPEDPKSRQTPDPKWKLVWAQVSERAHRGIGVGRTCLYAAATGSTSLITSLQNVHPSCRSITR